MRYAIINSSTNVVANVVVWEEPLEQLVVEPGHIAVEDPDKLANIDFIWDGVSAYTPPAETKPA